MNYEYKIKEEGKGWEETEITVIGNFPSPLKARKLAKALAKFEEREVRMNVEGSNQGHYFYPPYHVKS